MLASHEILRIYGKNYLDMTRALLEAAELDKLIYERFSRHARITVKPNLVSPVPAEFGATTHPEAVEGIVLYLRDKGFRNIRIAEGSWIGDKTADAYEYCGYRSLCERLQIPFTDLQKDAVVEINCAGLPLRVCRTAVQTDFLINVPVLKGHCQTRISCALKNMKGLLPNPEKRHFHAMGLHKPIAHLNAGLRQDFILVDHICGDPDFEDGGDPLVRSCLMAATDPVLTDAYACRLLGYDISEVPYIGLAEALGVGCADLSRLKLTDLGTPDPADVPLTHRTLDVSYSVEDADSCSACYGELIGALRRLREEGLADRLPCRLGIGQGFRGKKGAWGIGSCTAGFDFHVPGCPPTEEAIYQALKEKLSE